VQRSHSCERVRRGRAHAVQHGDAVPERKNPHTTAIDNRGAVYELRHLPALRPSGKTLRTLCTRTIIRITHAGSREAHGLDRFRFARGLGDRRESGGPGKPQTMMGPMPQALLADRLKVGCGQDRLSRKAQAFPESVNAARVSAIAWVRAPRFYTPAFAAVGNSLRNRIPRSMRNSNMVSGLSSSSQKQSIGPKTVSSSSARQVGR
jgi:hypothetical protein